MDGERRSRALRGDVAPVGRRAALRFGFAVELAAVLVVASLLGLYWACHSEFPGHRHAAGTPEHAHPVQFVTGAAAVGAPVALQGPPEHPRPVAEPSLRQRPSEAPVSADSLPRAPPAAA